MKIGFDGKRLTQNRTGLGNYSRFILQILTKYFAKNDYYIYAVREPAKLISDSEKATFRFRFPTSAKFSSLWRSWGIVKDLKRDDISLYHGLSNELPFGLKKANIIGVVTIHDLIFLRYPSYFPFIDRQIYRLKSKYAVRNADCIVAISYQTKRDIIDFFNIPSEKIKVIYQNCSQQFRNKIGETERAAIRVKYDLPNRYLLNVGTIEDRKNLLLIAQALPHIDIGLKLVVIGRQTSYAKTVKDYLKLHDLEHRVVFLHNVLTEDLPGIYQQCEVFIYPSKFEGFGIPVIEALHSSVPVIAAMGSSLEEAGGKHTIYIKPDDPKELAKSVKSVTENSILRQEMIDQGHKHLENFNDEKLASQLIELYKSQIDYVER